MVSHQVTHSAVWHLLTGEYPPRCGGVGDYTQLVAQGLAQRGCQVHVWRPTPCRVHQSFATSKEGFETGPTQVEPRLTVHSVYGGFQGRGLRQLDRALDQFESPRTILVQYAPNAFGMRGMNIPFCFWLMRRSRQKDDVRVMFHEPFFYFAWRRPERNLLAAVQRVMASMLISASHRIYLSVPAWQRYLQPYNYRNREMIWLPIPATIPHCLDPSAVAANHMRLTRGIANRLIVGHFGTYADTKVLDGVLRELLDRSPQVIIILLGNNSQRYARSLVSNRHDWRERVFAFGYLSKRDVSLHLQVCDLLIQPYRDGASSRRTSLMAALANGVPTLTNIGFLSESLWSRDCPVPRVDAYDVPCFLWRAEELLNDKTLSRSVAVRCQHFYTEYFSLEKTLNKL